LPLFGAIVLTIWLPGTIAGLAIERSVPAERVMMVSFQFTNIVEGIFGPLYEGELVYALGQLKSGRRAGYAEAMGVGLGHWGRLFAARFMAGLIILLGFIALIIPGIILQLRFALLDEAVILEGAEASDARGRSAELTRGRRWSILLAGLFSFIVYLIASVALEALIEALGLIDNFSVRVVVDCITHILFATFEIVMFLYYWEAARQGPKPESPEDIL
jgi:hypothetical protein